MHEIITQAMKNSITLEQAKELAELAKDKKTLNPEYRPNLRELHAIDLIIRQARATD